MVVFLKYPQNSIFAVFIFNWYLKKTELINWQIINRSKGQALAIGITINVKILQRKQRECYVETKSEKLSKREQAPKDYNSKMCT